MKEYAKKLKIQNIFFAVGCVALIVVQVLALKGVIAPTYTNKNFADYWQGFIAGASTGLTLLFVIGIVINIRALRSEERLKKLYIKENDERTAAVCTKGRSAGASAGICTLIVAGIISGYFNITVFCTVVACVALLSLLMFIGKLYYCKKL